jgi:O-antigen ligase
VRVVSLAADDQAEWSPYYVRLSPVAVLHVALLLLVVANAGRIPLLDLGDRQAPILINDLCVGATIAIGAIFLFYARSLKLNDVALLGLLFAAIGGLSALSAIPRFGLSGMEIVASLAYLARWMLYFALYIVIINCVRVTDAESLWSALERAMLIIAAFGIVQAIFLPNFALMVYPNSREYNDWDPQRHRLVSTILEPNVAAGMIGAVLVVQLARMACGVRVALWKPVVMFAALLMALSRGGTFAFLTGCAVVIAAVGVRKKLVRFGALLFVLFLPVLPKFIAFGNEYGRFGISDDSAASRVRVWQRALATFFEHPWFGIGFNTYGFVQERRGFERVGGVSYSAEGGLLFIAVMTGIVGLAVFIAMLWVAIRRFRRAWRDDRATPAERGLLLGTAAATMTIFVDTIFVNTLFVPFVMEIMWVLWGLSFLIASDISRRATAPT